MLKPTALHAICCCCSPCMLLPCVELVPTHLLYISNYQHVNGNLTNGVPSCLHIVCFMTPHMLQPTYTFMYQTAAQTSKVKCSSHISDDITYQCMLTAAKTSTSTKGHESPDQQQKATEGRKYLDKGDLLEGNPPIGLHHLMQRHQSIQHGFHIGLPKVLAASFLQSFMPHLVPQYGHADQLLTHLQSVQKLTFELVRRWKFG